MGSSSVLSQLAPSMYRPFRELGPSLNNNEEDAINSNQNAIELSLIGAAFLVAFDSNQQKFNNNNAMQGDGGAQISRQLFVAYCAAVFDLKIYNNQ